MTHAIKSFGENTSEFPEEIFRTSYPADRSFDIDVTMYTL